MQNPIVRIIIMACAAIGILVFSVATSRMVVKKIFFTPKVEKHEAPEEQAEAQFGEVYVIEDLVINPAQSGGRRHLLVSIGLEYALDQGEDGGHGSSGDGIPTGLGLEIQTREPQIRDNIITLLAGQELSVLADIKYRERIRESLKKAVNYYLHDGQVERLYFTKYVFQ